MTDFDLVVLGGGTGNIVASAAAEEGLSVALVERGPLGGTCLNRGCNPSKKLVHHADVVETVRSADSFGVDVEVRDVAFADIVEGVTGTIDAAAERKTERARENDRITLFRAEGRFVGERTVGVEGEPDPITGERVVLAGGSRPVVPDSIDGTDDADFLTSAEALRLTDLPDRLVIVGGGYVAAEMGHFFEAMGADVTVVARGDVLLGREDREIAVRLTDAYRERFDLRLGYEATAIADDGDGTVVTAASDDAEIEVRGDDLLLAVGRRPNSDTWDVGAAGIETDDDGFVETDEYLRTSAEGVWAIGDIAGNYALKHSGDQEATYAVENAVRGNERPVEYPGMAHAVFGSPQVASLGETESDLDGREYEVGTYEYDETALGSVLDIRADAGFAKALVSPAPDDEVLGFHVVGPQASTLVHEVSTAVAAGADATRIAETIHVHPALSQVVQGAFRDVRDVAPSGI